MKTLEALADLLSEVTLTPIQQHWLDEYLRDLKALGDITDRDYRIDVLEDMLRDVEWDRDHLENEVEDLKEMNQDLEERLSKQSDYMPGVN